MTLSRYLSQPSGYTLVVVLMVIAMLTLLGIVALDTTVVDLQIAQGHKELRESFYLAEAAAMEGTQHLLNSPRIDRKECVRFWHHNLATLKQDDIDFTNPEEWIISPAKNVNARQSQLDPHAFMAAAEQRVAGGSSLIATGTRLYVNRIYGLCTKHRAENVVQVGYYMRY